MKKISLYDVTCHIYEIQRASIEVALRERVKFVHMDVSVEGRWFGDPGPKSQKLEGRIRLQSGLKTCLYVSATSFWGHSEAGEPTVDYTDLTVHPLLLSKDGKTEGIQEYKAYCVYFIPGADATDGQSCFDPRSPSCIAVGKVPDIFAGVPNQWQIGTHGSDVQDLTCLTRDLLGSCQKLLQA